MILLTKTNQTLKNFRLQIAFIYDDTTRAYYANLKSDKIGALAVELQTRFPGLPFKALKPMIRQCTERGMSFKEILEYLAISETVWLWLMAGCGVVYHNAKQYQQFQAQQHKNSQRHHQNQTGTSNGTSKFNNLPYEAAITPIQVSKATVNNYHHFNNHG